MSRTRVLGLILLFLTLFIVSTASAQSGTDSLETLLTTKMKGKMLSLRIPSASEKLRFDASGRLLGNEKHGVASLDRDIIVLAAKVRRDSLELDGERVYYSWDEATNALVPNVQAIPAKVEIDMPAGGISETSIEAALTKIFLTMGELQQQRCNAVETGTSKYFLAPNFAAPGNTTTKTSIAAVTSKSQLDTVCFPSGERGYLIRKGVKPPKAVSTPDPEYSDYARLKRIQGTAVYAILIDEKGLVSDALLVRSIEPSLNFNGVVALRNWKFQPAGFQGEAVPSAVHVEINFRLH